jgi:hypothetical protein
MVHSELDVLGRAELMLMLLDMYEARGEGGDRKVVKLEGSPVRSGLCEALLFQLQAWVGRHGSNNNRPSISAKSYMILRTPAEFAKKDSKRARIAARKLAQYHELWELARAAIAEEDAAFAETFSALAVTYGFQGSPHIDKQNTSNFYGLSLGDFPEGQGGICVECSPFVVAEVNTKNRLAKVDGRFVHWVAPYDESSNRYSLIYYQTTDKWLSPTTAVFGVPKDELL